MSKVTRGFTLIEILTALVIVAILAAIAYPSYINQIIRSNRNVAKADLMELQQWMERNYTLTNNYSQLPNGTALGSGSLPFPTSPRSGGALYDITFSAGPTATTYTLQAVPITTGTQNKDTLCKTLTLTQAGTPGISGGTGTVADCWPR